MEDRPLEIIIPDDLPPEDALEVVIGLCQEIRHPLNRLEFLANVLTDPSFEDIHSDVAQQIRDMVDGVRYILDIIYAYDAKRTELHPYVDEQTPMQQSE